MKRVIYCSFFMFTFLAFTLVSNAQRSINDQRATLIIQSSSFTAQPSIASQIENGTFVQATEIEKEVNPKQWGKNTSVPGKGLPMGNDPLWVKQQNAVKSPGKAPLLTFEAASATATPTDPTGAVGPNHFVNAWNSSFRIWDKNGNPLTSPASLGTIFPGTMGDPIVIYDRYADRFVISEFFSNGFYVGISQGPDPVNDGWYTWTFATNTFPDYPKYSVWSDGYYITANKDQSSAGSSEVVFVLDRNSMIAGNSSVTMVGFPLTNIVTSGFYSPLGFNANGPSLPPTGDAPIIYMQDDSWSGVSSDHLKIWNINVNWSSPSSSTISTPQMLSVSAFDGLFDGGSFSNLPQPSGSDIDALQATVMYMAQYRRFTGYNSVVLNFVVDLDGSDDYAGIRWYELRQTNDGLPWTVYQEGTYSQPGGHSAFAGNMCMDGNGNIALAYTTVSTSLYPSLRYTGRLASDPLGVMTMAEEVIANGTQSDPSFRYGDYSQMTIDPLDDATFWSIGEYFNGGRKNHVGVFQFAPAGLNAEFSASSTSICSGNTVSFSDQSTGSPVSWSWSFPGGSPSSYSGQNPPPITYSTPGFYDVTLIVNDGSTSDTETKSSYIEVNNVIADFSASGTTVIVGNSVAFTDNSFCNPTSWNWSFPGGTPNSFSGQNPPAITYNTAGTYDVILQVSNGSGSDTETKTGYINVINCTYCTSSFSNNNYEYVSNVTFNTINNTSTGGGYQDFTSISTDVTTGNIYNASVEVTVVGTYTENVFIFFDWNQDCDFDDAGESIDMGEVNATGTLTLPITVPNSAVTGPTRMRVIMMWNSDPTSCQTGTYGETEDYTVNVLSNTTPPVADFSASTTSPIIGNAVNFTDLTTGGPISWSWSFSPTTVTYLGGTTSASQNPQVQFDATGVYSVTLDVTNPYGSDSETKVDYITVFDTPPCSYCASNYSNTSDDWISNVDFNTISNSSGSVGYEDFTGLSTDLVPGNSYTIDVDVTVTGPWVQYASVWFDWNQDCDFADANESYTIGATPGTNGTFTLSTSIVVPIDALSGITRMRVSERYNTQPGSCDQSTYGETEDYTVNVVAGGIDLQLKVFLEGPYNGSTMNPDIVSYLPLDQPYDVAPWNYNGTESVTAIPSNDYIDWILVELRDAGNANQATAATVIDQMAAFLGNDGTVYDKDGNATLAFNSAVSNNLFVVVHHRNHISAMSGNAVTQSGGIYSYDFSTGALQAYGGNNGHKQLAGGAWGMFAADGNSDGMVDDLDQSALWETEAGNSGFLNSDFNLDGESNNIDKDDFWVPNNGEGSQVPN